MPTMRSSMGYGSFRFPMGHQPYSYGTSFAAAPENPISEGGKWHHYGDITNETVVATSIAADGTHFARCTMVGGGFDDSSAFVDGFHPNQSAQGTIWKSPTISGTGQECEILLRWVTGQPDRSTPFGPSNCIGYEINVNVDDGSFLNIGQFKVLPALATIDLSATIGRAPATGDVFKATIQDSGANAIITVYWNNVQVLQTTDTSPIRFGNPGIGFFHNAGESNTEFGFLAFSASDL